VGKTELGAAPGAPGEFAIPEGGKPAKFTEVGYVGRDVESMIRDLVDISIDMVREERLDEVADRAELNAEDRLLDLLMPPQPNRARASSARARNSASGCAEGKLDEALGGTRRQGPRGQERLESHIQPVASRT